MPPKTAGTYKVSFNPNDPTKRRGSIYVYATTETSAKQIVGKRYGLNEDDFTKVEFIA